MSQRNQPPQPNQNRRTVKGKRVTDFTNSQGEAVRLTEVVPFLVDHELKRLGGDYEQSRDWADVTSWTVGKLPVRTRFHPARLLENSWSFCQLSARQLPQRSTREAVVPVTTTRIGLML